MEEETGSNWQDWFQTVAGGVVDKWATAQYSTPYEIQKLRLNSLGERGYYTDGQPAQAVATASRMNPMYIMAGLALVALVMLKD